MNSYHPVLPLLLIEQCNPILHIAMTKWLPAVHDNDKPHEVVILFAITYYIHI